jgi:hypothetical protein
MLAVDRKMNDQCLFPQIKNRLEGRFRYWLSDDLTAPRGMRISDQVQSSRLRRLSGVLFGNSCFVWTTSFLSQFFCFTAEYAEIAEKFFIKALRTLLA